MLPSHNAAPAVIADFSKTLVDRGPACGRRNGFTYRGRAKAFGYVLQAAAPQAPQAVGVS
jgi:hypothetical protein